MLLPPFRVIPKDAVEWGRWFRQATLGLGDGRKIDDAIDEVETDIESKAPKDASFLVGASDDTLTAERVVTDSDTTAWDLTTAGQAKVNLAYKRTDAEIAAGVTPTDYAYAPGESERNGLDDGTTTNTAALTTLLGGAYADVKIQPGAFAVDGIEADIHAGIISGSGIQTRITATGAHTITLPADRQDTHLRDLWVDQLAASGSFDAIHALGGEWHLSDIDIDFSPRYGIYVGAYRTQLEKIQSQACLDTAVYVLSTAFRGQASQLIFENAGTAPGNGINLNSDHWNVSDLTSFTIAGYTAQLAGRYNTLTGFTATGSGGSVSEDFLKITGTFNTAVAGTCVGTAGIAYNITGNSNVALGLISNNASKQGLLISGNNVMASGRIFNSGVGNTLDAVAISGTDARVDLDVSTHTGTYDINATGTGAQIRGCYAGAVRLTGAQANFSGKCRNLVVQGDPTASTAAFCIINATITGAEAIGADIQGNSNSGVIVFVNAGTTGIHVGGNQNGFQVRVFGAGTTGIDLDGDNNVLSCTVGTSGTNDLVIDGNRNHITGNFEGNVVINGDQNRIDAVITGNLTINVGAQTNRISGICLGTVTNSGTSTNLDELTYTP